MTFQRCATSVVVILAATAACSDHTPTALESAGESLSTLLVVSAPSAPAVAAAVGSGARFLPDRTIAVATSSAYVSLPPATVRAGVRAAILNRANGQSVTTSVVNGGFDPIPIAGAVGDDLTVDILGAAGTLWTSKVTIPRHRPPTIVRTDPPNGRTDVPLNNRVAIVFSEPMEPATVAGSVQLLRGDAAVAGSVTLIAPGLIAEFTPDAPLAPNAQYQLVISSAIENLNGDRLEAEHRITFTTGESDMLASLFAGGRSLYVANDGRGTNTFDGQLPIFQHGMTVYTGSAVPTDTIAGDNTGLSSLGPGGIAVDAAGRIYAASSAGTDAIFVYAPGATGNAAPANTIQGSNTGLNYPQGIALDAEGNLYVVNSGAAGPESYTITVYEPGAKGNATPIAAIEGKNTGLNVPIGVAVDATGRVYIANDGAITVYAAGANGNAAPIATIQGSRTGLQRPIGVAVDGSGNIYVANFLACGGDPATQSILVFAPGANGNATPIATIQGDRTGLDGAYGISVDPAGRLYVANATSCPEMMTVPPESPSFGSITVYAPGASGNVPPLVRIAGTTSGLLGPSWIVFR